MSINPLFAVELRGRFRRLTSFWQLALAIGAGALLLGFLMLWPQAATARVAATGGVEQLRAQGVSILLAYRLWGGLLYAFVGVLVGAMSILHEKNAGTFEHLLLSPLRARGIVRGKVASSLAFLFLLQLALLPLTMGMGALCLLKPAQILWVSALHFGGCAQGVTLGILGAVRARSIASAVANALGWWLAVVFLLGAVAYATALTLGAIYLIFNVVIGAVVEAFGWWGIASWIRVSWAWLSQSLLIPFGWGAASLAGGVLGAAALIEKGATIPLVFVGQMLGVVYFARWSAWQMGVPNRRLLPLGWEAWVLLLTRRSWQLAPLEAALFPIVEVGDERVKFAPPKKESSTKNSGRIRLFSARRFENINPVFWLDLQRCLSLRAPSPATQLPLLLFAALGGALALAAGMAGLVSLLANTRSNADLSELYHLTRWILCYLALGCGPLFSTTGYVIERRSMMLHELRLTLLSARGLWWGKLSARWIIAIVGALPGLVLLQFFADNMRGAPAFALLSESLLIFGIAAASIGVCLWLSYHAANPLAAALWCLAFAIIVGGPLWNGGHFWAPLQLVSPLVTLVPARCALIYVAVAALSNGSIAWNLRRLGFGKG